MQTTLGTRVAIGVAIAAALGLADVIGLFAPPPEIGAAPPFAATLFAAVAGAVTLISAGLLAWAARREPVPTVGRVALWLVVASRVASVLVAVPTTFLLGVTVPLVAWSVVTVALTVAVVVLVITGAVRDPAPTS